MTNTSKHDPENVQRIIHHEQVAFIQVMKSSVNISESINVTSEITRNGKIIVRQSKKIIDKIQYPFRIKTLSIPRIGGNFQT